MTLEIFLSFSLGEEILADNTMEIEIILVGPLLFIAIPLHSYNSDN
jgi:hypothetical protein